MEFTVENNKDHVGNVKTFVLFDTETTGLPSPGDNPRFVELCFVALTREELLTPQRTSRVLNKLCLCFNPRKKICHRASEITGLYNDALEDLATFQKQAPSISMFLKNLPQPACLIAHNGNSFDFPLLVSHLKKANEEVPEGILCADSLEAFRMFDGLPPAPDFVTQQRKINIVSSLAIETNPKIKSSNINNEVVGNGRSERRTTDIVGSGCGDEEKSHVPCSDLQKRSADSDLPAYPDVKSKHAKLSVHEIPAWAACEQTPERSSLDNAGLNRPQAKSNSQEDQYRAIGKVRRQIFERGFDKEQAHQYLNPQSDSEDKELCGNQANKCSKDISDFSIQCSNVRNSPDMERDTSSKYIIETVPASNGAVSENRSGSQFNCNLLTPSCQNEHDAVMSPSQRQKVSYSLPELYFRTFGRKPELTHTAEDDCLSLLKIIHNSRKTFPIWCDRHAVLLKNIPAMY